MKFIYKTHVVGHLTRAEADVIWNHATQHPDTKRFTLPGGYLYSFVNYFKDQDVEADFTFRETDIMLKALEWPLEDTPERCSLRDKLKGWIDAINAESRRLHADTPEEKPKAEKQPFTPDEEEIMNLLVQAHNKFAALERMHTSEIPEWVISLHKLQDILFYRVVKRDYPEYIKS